MNVIRRLWPNRDSAGRGSWRTALPERFSRSTQTPIELRNPHPLCGWVLPTGKVAGATLPSCGRTVTGMEARDHRVHSILSGKVARPASGHSGVARGIGKPVVRESQTARKVGLNRPPMRSPFPAPPRGRHGVVRGKERDGGPTRQRPFIGSQGAGAKEAESKEFSAGCSCLGRPQGVDSLPS